MSPESQVLRSAQTSMIAALIVSCGGGGSTADAGRRGEDAAPDAAMEPGTGSDGGDVAIDAMTHAGGDAAIDAMTHAGGDAAIDAMTDAGGGGTRDASDGSPGGSAADVVLSDRCTNGIISIASDVLNPGDVYLNGTLKVSYCTEDALTHWSDPNSACTGFDCYFDPLTAVIRPTDGRMLYMNTFEYALREFHADSCPMPPMSAYPSAPLANDTIIPTPMCPATDAGTTGVTRTDGGLAGVAGFVVSPEGDVYYHCFVAEAVWYDLAGKAVYDESNGYRLYKIARGRMALVQQTQASLSVSVKFANLTTGVLTDIPTWTTGSILAIRALDPAGFWVAVGFTSSDPELWAIHTDGTSTKIGSYPPVPTGQGVQSSAGQAALDGCGALLQISYEGASGNAIVRRQVQGSSLVVYDDATMPFVRIDSSYLVTGP